MRLLLDTHVWLWLLDDPARLAPEVRDACGDEGAELHWSSVCAWEMAVKHGLGKLRLPVPPGEYVSSRVAASGAHALPITHDHALRVADLPPHHRDPFDRLLVAQAQVEHMTLVTTDPQVKRYDVALLEA